jgi:hypothetical protein
MARIFCRAILDEGHRLAVALHRHHDVQARLAHLPEVALLLRVGDLHHAARQAEVRHQLHQLLQPRGLALLARELHQQDGVRLALDERIHRRAERRYVARQPDHGAVDQLHRRGSQLHDVLGQVHGGVELREMAHAKRALRRDARELEVQALRIGERAFGADEQMRRIGMRRAEVVEVIARHLAQHFRKARLDFLLFPLVERFQLREKIHVRSGPRVIAHRPETPALALRGDRIDGEHVVHHVAVGDGARAAGVVARHAAEGRLRAGGDVDREPQALRPQPRVERIQHQSRLDDGAVGPDLEHFVEVLRVVDDQGLAHCLPALRAAGAARQNRYPFVRCDRQSAACRLLGTRHDDTDRLQLVDRGVGGIAPSACRVEQDFGVQLLRQARREAGLRGLDQANGRGRGVHGAK